MSANTLTTLIPVLIGSIQNVARNTGFLFNAASIDATAEGAAKGQSVKYSTLPDIAAGDVTPGVTVPDATGQTSTEKTLTLDQHKEGKFNLSAEDSAAIAERGAEFRSVNIDAAVASVIGAAADYLAEKMTLGAGNAYGAAGTDPFASNPNILVDAWQGMADDKAPDMDRFSVLSTAHYASAAKLAQFQKLAEAPRGTDFAVGRLGMLSNWMTGYDQAVGRLQTTTAGGGYQVNNASGYAAGAKEITVDTGSGGFAAGDVITIAGNVIPGTTTLAKMVVASATATVVTLTRGLLTAVADDASVVRIASHRSSILAHKAATVLAIRPSKEMPEGDLATVRQIVRDPVTGIALRLAYYPGYHMGNWAVSGVFGCVVRRPEWVKRVIS